MGLKLLCKTVSIHKVNWVNIVMVSKEKGVSSVVSHIENALFLLKTQKNNRTVTWIVFYLILFWAIAGIE